MRHFKDRNKRKDPFGGEISSGGQGLCSSPDSTLLIRKKTHQVASRLSRLPDGHRKKKPKEERKSRHPYRTSKKRKQSKIKRKKHPRRFFKWIKERKNLREGKAGDEGRRDTIESEVKGQRKRLEDKQKRGKKGKSKSMGVLAKNRVGGVGSLEKSRSSEGTHVQAKKAPRDTQGKQHHSPGLRRKKREPPRC